MSQRTYTIRIPFCGFDDSYASDRIEEDHYKDLQPAYVSIAQEYTKIFNTCLNKTIGFNVNLSFEELISPLFYDEDNDTINCKVSKEDLKKLYEHLDHNELKRTYEDSVFFNLDWSLPVTEWNLDQTEVMFHALIRQHDIDALDYEELLKLIDIEGITEREAVKHG